MEFFFAILSSYLKESIFCMGIQDKDGIPHQQKKLKVIELLSARNMQEGTNNEA